MKYLVSMALASVLFVGCATSKSFTKFDGTPQGLDVYEIRSSNEGDAPTYRGYVMMKDGEIISQFASAGVKLSDRVILGILGGVSNVGSAYVFNRAAASKYRPDTTSVSGVSGAESNSEAKARAKASGYQKKHIKKRH